MDKNPVFSWKNHGEMMKHGSCYQLLSWVRKREHHHFQIGKRMKNYGLNRNLRRSPEKCCVAAAGRTAFTWTWGWTL